MEFYCPDSGVTTSGSHYPRSELRNLSEWTLAAGTHHLSAVVAVEAQPGTREIIIGQIHGTSGGSEALKMRWSNGDILVGYKTSIGSPERKVLLLSRVKIGQRFSYSITQTSVRKVIVAVNDQTYTITYDSRGTLKVCILRLGTICRTIVVRQRRDR